MKTLIQYQICLQSKFNNQYSDHYIYSLNEFFLTLNKYFTDPNITVLAVHYNNKYKPTN